MVETTKSHAEPCGKAAQISSQPRRRVGLEWWNAVDELGELDQPAVVAPDQGSVNGGNHSGDGQSWIDRESMGHGGRLALESVGSVAPVPHLEHVGRPTGVNPVGAVPLPG